MSKPSRIRSYLPDADVLLMGCQPWPPATWTHRGWPDVCPVCGWSIDDPSRTACGWCLEVAPRREGYLAAQRTIANAADAARDREQRDRLRLAKAGKSVLSETERRRIWNGYRRSIFVEIVGTQLTDLASEGRKWLVQIDQAPDFSLPIEHRTRRYA